MFTQSKSPVSEPQALQKLAALCSRSEHSSGEIREKMRRWQLPSDAQERIVQRLVDEATAAEALGEVADDEWLAVLRNVIAAKRRTTKAASDYELNAKLMRHALSRGFTMRLIEQCVDTPD